MKLYPISIATGLCCVASTTFAQISSVDNPIIVTASRTAQTVNQTLASVTVITREQIEKSQAETVADLLQHTPGLSVTNSGGMGKSTGVFLRGTTTKDLLVLVDGIRIGSATTGQVSIESINVEQIERIEIVRGPRSSLYGSDAAGGVIQIFTRKGGGKVTPSMRVTVGSNATRTAAVGVKGGGENQWFNLSTTGTTTEGFNATTTGDNDRDGYRNKGVEWRVGTKVGEQSEIEAFYTLNDAESEYDGWTDRSDFLTQLFSIQGKTRFTDQWDSRLNVARTWDKSKNYQGSNFFSRFNTQRDSITWQNDLVVTPTGLLTLGVDYNLDKVDSTTNYSQKSRHNTGLFSQYQWKMLNSDWQLSLREDNNEQFGRYTTGGVAWGMPLSNTLDVAASYGTAFKAPSFNSLYYPFSGDPDLLPEESDSFEVSLRGNHDQLTWKSTLYHTEFTNMTEWVQNDSNQWSPMNISPVMTGLELEASYVWGEWRLSGDLSFIEHELSDGLYKGKSLIRRPTRIANISVDRSLGQWGLGVDIHAENRRYNKYTNTDYLPAFTLVDLRASYQLTPEWAVRGKVKNLFDTGYETVTNYNQEGRTFLFTLAYQPR